MKIDRNAEYHFGKYTYVNFVNLTCEELLTVLEWRNHPDVRKYLNTTERISVDSHLSFCDSLKNRDDKFYWVIKKGDRPVGVLNIIDVNYEDETCESGFYLLPNLMGSGEGLFAMCNYKTFILDVLGFKCVIGHNYYDNMSALVITMFFGAIINGVEEHDGKLCIETLISKETLQNGEGTDKLILKFASFARSWNADDAIKKYRNGK